jgi:hypothetical protein
MGLILLIVLIVLLFGEFDWGYHGLIVVVGVRHCFTALKTFVVFSRLPPRKTEVPGLTALYLFFGPDYLLSELFQFCYSHSPLLPLVRIPRT